MQSTKSRRLTLSSYGTLAALAAFVVVAAAAPVGAQATKQAAIEAKHAPKEVSVDLANGIKLELLLIPAGEFMMGSPESETSRLVMDKPQHRVRITKPFFLGKFPVTQQQWESVMGHNPSLLKSPKHPVVNVSWYDCEGFFKKLNVKVGGATFQLPTEAQWEYACRAGTKTRFPFGNDESKLGDYAWYGHNADGVTHPVGGKKPNAWGLYDMHGNASQWCADWYDESYYAKSITNDPPGAATGFHRCIRGGDISRVASLCRSSTRNAGQPALREEFLGVRVARVAEDR
jgi:formylglycine-generating enzyme required for sulfatase activity